MMYKENPNNPIDFDSISKHFPHGLILVITAIPTVDEDGHEALGGIGESVFAGELACQLGQSSVVKTGDFQRGKTSEASFYKERMDPTRLNEKALTDQDLDCQFFDAAVTTAKETGIAIVSSKLFPFIFARELAQDTNHELPAIVVIGVLANDMSATELFLERIAAEEKTNVPTLAEAKALRVQRMLADQKIYEKAHGDSIPPYTRENIMNFCHYFIDNTTKFSSKKAFNSFKNKVIQEMLTDLNQLFQSHHLTFPTTPTYSLQNDYC